MKNFYRSEKNNSPAVIRPGRAFISCLPVFICGVLFLSYPGPVEEAKAADTQTRQAPAEGADCLVSGIFYEEENPRALINEELFSLNSFCCGGRITGIFNDYIVMELPSGKREYRIGDVIRKEKKAGTQPQKTAAGLVSGTPSYYVKKSNSIVEGFMASHSQHNAAFDIRSFVSADEAVKIRARAKAMVELIHRKKEQLSGISAPPECRRHYSLALKLFDIAEDGWNALLSGKKDQAEVYFDRLAKVSEEISRESVSILAR